MLERIRAPFFIDNSELFASTSIGVSLYPEHGNNYDALRHNADIAMYRVKNAGKGTAAFFDDSMEREAQARMKVEQSLRLAILEKRFCCAFQPKVDIRTRDIKGIEALVRLRDDEGVIQAPGTFINLATELGLIDELGGLDAAIAYAAEKANPGGNYRLDEGTGRLGSGQRASSSPRPLRGKRVPTWSSPRTLFATGAAAD
jgi:predicted signal transduction protein with EAL and GGDEF domain